MRKTMRRSSGRPALRSTMAFCTSMAQRTASTTLRNSTRAPSPVRFMTRPLCTEIVGSMRSLFAASPAALPAGVRGRILAYLGVLLVLLGFGSPGGGLIGLPLSFLLKNKLHLEAHEMAIIGLIVGAPSYVSFLFGFARDTWNPFGMRDRGFMVLFGGQCAAVYVVFAFMPVTYQTLLVAYLLLGTSFLFVSSAQNGLTSAIGQQHVMSGQVGDLALSPVHAQLSRRRRFARGERNCNFVRNNPTLGENHFGPIIAAELRKRRPKPHSIWHLDEGVPRKHQQQWGCGAAYEMRAGPSKPTVRGRLQTTASCDGKEPWW